MADRNIPDGWRMLELSDFGFQPSDSNHGTMQSHPHLQCTSCTNPCEFPTTSLTLQKSGYINPIRCFPCSSKPATHKCGNKKGRQGWFLPRQTGGPLTVRGITEDDKNRGRTKFGNLIRVSVEDEEGEEMNPEGEGGTPGYVSAEEGEVQVGDHEQEFEDDDEEEVQGGRYDDNASMMDISSLRAPLSPSVLPHRSSPASRRSASLSSSLPASRGGISKYRGSRQRSGAELSETIQAWVEEEIANRYQSQLAATGERMTQLERDLATEKERVRSLQERLDAIARMSGEGD